MSTESVMLSKHLILCHPSSCVQPFPASGKWWWTFSVSHLFTSGGQSIEASASVLPVNIQGWFSYGLTVCHHLSTLLHGDWIAPFSVFLIILLYIFLVLNIILLLTFLYISLGAHVQGELRGLYLEQNCRGAEYANIEFNGIMTSHFPERLPK